MAQLRTTVLRWEGYSPTIVPYPIPHLSSPISQHCNSLGNAKKTVMVHNLYLHILHYMWHLAAPNLHIHDLDLEKERKRYMMSHSYLIPIFPLLVPTYLSLFISYVSFQNFFLSLQANMITGHRFFHSFLGQR